MSERSNLIPILPSHTVDRKLIGAVMLFPEVLKILVFDPADLDGWASRKAWKAILSLWRQGKYIEPASVGDEAGSQFYADFASECCSILDMNADAESIHRYAKACHALAVERRR